MTFDRFFKRDTSHEAAPSPLLFGHAADMPWKVGVIQKHAVSQIRERACAETNLSEQSE